MNAPLRCPHCAGTLTTAGRPTCEWCGAALPGGTAGAAAAEAAAAAEQRGAAAERARLAATLASLQQAKAGEPARTSGAGCLFFALLAAVVLFVLSLLFFGVREAAPTPSPALPEGPERASDR